jgi:hypothetical protein
MEIAGEQSPNDFSFSVKTQTKSAFEILVLAITPPPGGPPREIYRYNPAVVCPVPDTRISAPARWSLLGSPGVALPLGSERLAAKAFGIIRTMRGEGAGSRQRVFFFS